MNTSTLIQERIKVIHKLALENKHPLGYKIPTRAEIVELVASVLDSEELDIHYDSIPFLIESYYKYIVSAGSASVLKDIIENPVFSMSISMEQIIELITKIGDYAHLQGYDLPGDNLIRLKKSIESGEPTCELFKELSEDDLDLFKENIKDISDTALDNFVMHALDFYLYQYANDLRNRIKIVEFKKCTQLDAKGLYDIYIVPGYDLTVLLELSRESKRYVVTELGYKEVFKSNFKGLGTIRDVYIRTDVHF